MHRTFMAALLASSALVFVPTAGALGDPVGRVTMVNVWAYGTPPNQATRDLFEPEVVNTDEVVRTVTRGALHLSFLDNSVLRLGSASTVTLDEFVYDPSTSGGEMAINLSKGAFRFISGNMAKSGILFRTPSATIGVRGTDFAALVGEDGTTRITVYSGEVIVTPLAGGAPVSVAAGQDLTVSLNGETGELGNGFRTVDPGLDEDEGFDGSSGGPGGSGGGGEGG
ncbi:FecR protein [Oceanibacterium hippocampi]|uniref:FecR protein n=2 Tax=Oceanibacterium hippocampi TaxID=745714 RepID=A0A1Y5U0R6_9PROT|nr:FecR family protein [Oceanibacterium hippocampi]SLN77520.1 FecR protein [Oceanibacterium hippocampi]